MKTAEEVLDKYSLHQTYQPHGEPLGTKWHDNDCPFCRYEDDVIKAMIEFAKLHVKAALITAAAKAYAERDWDWIWIVDNWIVNKDSILHAYPNELIK